MFKRHKLTSLRKYFIKTGELSRAELKNIKGKADGYIHFGKLDGTCYMDRLLQGLDASDASVKSFSQEMIYSSLTGLEPDALRDLETENVKFKEYLSSIGISAEKKQSEVLERIKKGNFLSASSKIKEITGADSDDAYILKIRKIYGENTIYIK